MSLFLAPMEGVVDFILRDLLTQLGNYTSCTSEFVRVTDKTLPASVFYKICPELKTAGKTSNGTPVLVQLLGGQPQPLADNAAFAAELGALGIDLNFGCPAKTVNRHDGGAVILKQPDRVYKITETVKHHLPKSIPLTVKIRLGYESTDLAVENALAAQAAGATRLTVHARTKLDGYRPPARWELLAKIQESLSIPVTANGDIWTTEDFKKCREVTGCSSFMLGRGAVADPLLARKIQLQDESFTWQDLLRVFQDFVHRSAEFSGEKYAVSRAKQWSRLLGRNFPEAQTLFAAIKTMTSYAALRNHLLKV